MILSLLFNLLIHVCKDYYQGVQYLQKLFITNKSLSSIFFFMYLWIIVLKDVICLLHLTNYICDTFQCILCFSSSFYIMYFKFTFQNLNSSLFSPKQSYFHICVFDVCDCHTSL